MVCGKGERFVLIRTGPVSSVEPESLSPLYKKDLVREKEESKSKAGIAAAFGSVLDYNVGMAWAPTSKSTASDRSEIYLRNLSDLIANRGLRLSYRGPPSRLAGFGGVPPLPIKYYNAQTRIARKTPTAVRPLLTLRR